MTREDAIKILNTVLCLGKCDCLKDEIEECLKMAIEALEPQPNERTEECTEMHECDCISRKGYWIERKHGGIEHIECSKCKCWFLRKDLIRNSYCPNCGSRNHWEWESKM